MKSAVTISLVPQARGGPFVFWGGLADSCQRAAELGFDAIEIFPPAAAAIKQSELRELLKRHGQQVAAMGTGGGWVVQKLSLTHADPAIRKQAKEFIGEMIDVASEFEAPAIIGSMQGRCEGIVSYRQAVAWLGEAINELGQRAAKRGQLLLFEPLNRYETNLFNRINETALFLDTLSARNIRILADLFHMNIEERSTPAALRDAAKYIGHVHFADSNRQAVGFGQTSITPIVQTLRQIGYSGYLSAEILPLPDANAAARQAIKSFRQYTAESC